MKIKDYANIMNEHRSSLFTGKDRYFLDHTDTGKSILFQQLPESLQLRMKCDNMHLTDGMLFTEKNGIPQLAPNHSADTNVELFAYSNRNKHKDNAWGIHFFNYDYKFLRAITIGLERTTSAIMNCDLVFAPDCSLFVDAPTPFINKQNIYRSRFAAAYWQLCGLNVIQTASWGDANSLKYSFEGLAENSVTAVCGIGHDFCKSAKTLWLYAIKTLVDTIYPSKLIVYGGQKDSLPDLGIPVQYIEDFITKRFRNNGK